MSSRQPHLAAKHLKTLSAPLFISATLIALAFFPLGLANSPQVTQRTIISEDFIKNRPQRKVRRNSARKSKAPNGESSSGRVYRLASQSSTRPLASFSTAPQVGLTIWKLRRASNVDARAMPSGWIAERVEADTEFREGDYLRLSIESPRAGYLYVIDRDWFVDGNFGETNMIFPIRGDDNRLIAGRLIDIPAENQAPFRATPKPDQAGEILTIIVTTTPLRLPISNKPLPISDTELMEWEEMWGGATERFELENGAGQVRTKQEQQAASRKGTRQLTRDDPPPQTIYVLATNNSGAFLFNVKLSYAR